MTPRSLVTAIGAMAIAFAVVIGVASGNPSNVPSPRSDAVVAVARLDDEALPETPTQLAAWNDSCVIAL